MGNSHPSGKVILSDGGVFTYVEPITAAELMLEYPHHMVVELDREFISRGRRPTPLPADRKLNPKKLYLMLPIRKGKAAKPTPEVARKLLAGIRSTSRSHLLSSFTGIVPFLARIRPAAAGGATPGVLESKCSPESNDSDDDADVQPEILSPQLSARGWKPSLDTIMETMTATGLKSTSDHWIRY